MRQPLTTIALSAVLLSLSSVAQACRDDDAMTSTMRREIPWSEKGQVVAEVEVDRMVDVRHFLWGARIIRMIKGNYTGTRMIIALRDSIAATAFRASVNAPLWLAGSKTVRATL